MRSNIKENMFSEEIKKMIGYLKTDRSCIEISQENIFLEERSKDGEAKLDLIVNSPCIAFKQVDKNKNSYFAYKKCADNMIFQNVNNTWVLHIVEFKKTVKSDEWEKIKTQFLGCLLNAIGMAGYLGINIDYKNIQLYTCFRNDKINSQRLASPIELRGKVGKSLKKNNTDDWEVGEVELSDFNKLKCRHNKIELNKDTGYAKYFLK
ncbi:MAG: hypothetical protein NSGCLCUN01_03643 [uncultured Clostridium sp.]